MSKTLIAVNTLTAVGSQPYASHLNLAFRMAKECPEDEFLFFNGYRMSIDRFRNEAGKIALQNECDYLLFLDDDVLIPRDTYRQLKKHDVDVITPLVYIRSYPFKPMFFNAVKTASGVGVLVHYENWQENWDREGILRCAAIGFSCCLMKTSILKEIPPAWFVTGTNHTEDVYFCVKAQNVIPGIVIAVDPNIQAGHMLDPEFVSFQTRDALLRYYEDLHPELKNNGINGDNTLDWVEKQLGRLEESQLMELTNES